MRNALPTRIVLLLARAGKRWGLSARASHQKQLNDGAAVRADVLGLEPILSRRAQKGIRI